MFGVHRLLGEGSPLFYSFLPQNPCSVTVRYAAHVPEQKPGTWKVILPSSPKMNALPQNLTQWQHSTECTHQPQKGCHPSHNPLSNNSFQSRCSLCPWAGMLPIWCSRHWSNVSFLWPVGKENLHLLCLLVNV